MTYLRTKTLFNSLVGSISAAPSGPVWFHRLISQNGAENYGQTGNENLQLVLLRNELKNNCASCVSRDLKLDKNTREPHHTRNLRPFLQNKFALDR